MAQDALNVVKAGMLEEEIIGTEAIIAARGLARSGIVSPIFDLREEAYDLYSMD